MKLFGGTGCVNVHVAIARHVCGGRFDMTLIEARRNSLGGAGWVGGLTDAHPRGAAVAQRLRSAFFCCAPRRGKHHERPLPQKALRLRDRSVGFWFSNCGPARPQADSSKVDGVRMRHTTQYANMAKPSAVTFFP